MKTNQHQTRNRVRCAPRSMGRLVALASLVGATAALAFAPLAHANEPETKKAPAEGAEVSVYFGFDSAELTDDAERSLAKFTRNDPLDDVQNIRVEGHTDAMGPSDYNRTLAKKRAESVAAYLLSKGVPADKIEVVAIGEGDRGPDAQPMASNEPAAEPGATEPRDAEAPSGGVDKMETDATSGPIARADTGDERPKASSRRVDIRVNVDDAA